MIYALSGKIEAIDGQIAVIDVGGVSFAVNTSMTTLSRLHIGKDAKLYTYLHVREDILDLYGFYDTEELGSFKMLISISGVGPRVGLAILSVTTPQQLVLSIVSEDAKSLTAASGVGTKLAQRIILELRDKVAKDMKNISESFKASKTPAFKMDNAISEAIAALGVLGYSATQASNALADVKDEGLSTSEYIKRALKILGKGV